MAASDVDWEDIKGTVLGLARQGLLLPFVGSAISYPCPTALPLGNGLVQSILRGVFGSDFGALSQSARARIDTQEAMRRFLQHSPEVILQALAEGFENRDCIGAFYNQMAGLPPNRLHYILARALTAGGIPALFTTNQDDCFESAAQGNLRALPRYGPTLGQDLVPTIYQFHGATGGATSAERDARLKSLTFTLHSMGPRLPDGKQSIVEQALKKHAVLFLGHSASDPDIWYSLDVLLERMAMKVYWCYHSGPSSHLCRLAHRHPSHITMFKEDMLTVLPDLAGAWCIDVSDTPEPTMPSEAAREATCDRIASCPVQLTCFDRDLAFGWLLVATGQHREATRYLDAVVRAAPKDDSTGSLRKQMMASLFAGYSHRELSEHRQARAHLRKAIEISVPDQLNEPLRHAQAVHKLGESMGAVECVLPWHFWPHVEWTNEPAKLLKRAIAEYQSVPDGKRLAQGLRSAGLGTAVMNLGQLYRRASEYPAIPDVTFSRRKLRELGLAKLREAVSILTLEGDMRDLSMATAALNGMRNDVTDAERAKGVDLAVDLAESWTRDDIQIGSAYYQRGLLDETHPPTPVPDAFLRSWNSFHHAEMHAETARVSLDLAKHVVLEANRAFHDAEGTWCWRLMMGLIWSGRVVRALLRNPWFGWPVLVVFALLIVAIMLIVGAI